jgi:hypothetical protein
MMFPEQFSDFQHYRHLFLLSSKIILHYCSTFMSKRKEVFADFKILELINCYRGSLYCERLVWKIRQ